jgi:hypothetical protein
MVPMGISDRHSIRIRHGEQAEKRASLFFFGERKKRVVRREWRVERKDKGGQNRGDA